MRVLRLVLSAAMFGIVAFSVSAQEFDFDALPSLSPETGALILTGITAQEASDAVDGFVMDGADGETVLALAKAGHPVAASVMARRCLREGPCPTTSIEAHDLLVAAAQIDAGSAETLAVLYRDGKWGGQAYPVSAAKWLGHAEKLGSKNTLILMRTLPREAVVKAGYGAMLEAETETETEQAGGLYSITEEEAAGLAALLFAGIEATPVELDWPGRERGFPVFADTAMSAQADAAASCRLVVMDDVLGLVARKEAGQTLSNFDQVRGRLDTIRAEKYHRTTYSKVLNGGLDEAVVDRAYAEHERVRAANPEFGPSVKFCRDNYEDFSLAVLTE